MCPSRALLSRARERHPGDVLPNRIKHYRGARGLSQEALAQAVGTTRNMLVKLERGDRKLDVDWLEKLGGALEVEPYLLIAPDDVLPSEDELQEMLDASQRTLPAGLPYSEWPRAVAQGLHTRIRTLAADRASSRAAD